MDTATTNLLITIVIAAVILGWRYFKRSGIRPESLDHQEEIKEIEKKREDVKVHSREEKVVKKKLINFFIIAVVVWTILYWPLVRPRLADSEVSTLIPNIASGVVAAIVIFMGANGFYLMMGCVAVRGKQKVIGGRTKKYEMLVGPHYPLNASHIRSQIDMWKPNLDSKKLPVFAKDAVQMEGDYYDIKWEDPSGDPRRTLIHNKKIKFLEKLSYADVQSIVKLVNTVLERRLGHDYHVSRLPADGLKLQMESLKYHTRDIQMSHEFFYGIHDYSPYVMREWAKLCKNNIGDSLEEQVLSNTHLEEQMKTLRTERVTRLLRWTLQDRFGFSQETVDTFIVGTEIPDTVPYFTRQTQDGVFFGGNYCEFCQVWQYDTSFVIFVLPFSWAESLDFEDRDWIDSSNMPFPMHYTDMDWRLLDTIPVQTAPGVFEAVNILVPLYVDKMLESLPGLTPIHAIDQATRREITIWSVEKGTAELQEENIELKAKEQRREALDRQERKYLGRLLNVLWTKLNSTSQMIKALWPILLATGVCCFFAGVFLSRLFSSPQPTAGEAAALLALVSRVLK